MYIALLPDVRGRGVGAPAVESSGIDSFLPRGGREARATLKLPVRVRKRVYTLSRKGREVRSIWQDSRK